MRRRGAPSLPRAATPLRPEHTAWSTRGLLFDFAAIGVEVVEEAEAEAEVGAGEFSWEGLEGIGTGNAALGWSIEGYVAGGIDDFQSLD